MVNNIKLIVDKILTMSGNTFNWITDPEKHINTGKDIGVIAQEVREVLPEITTIRENGMVAVKYDRLIPLLIKGFKEQQKEIEDLKKIINKQ